MSIRGRLELAYPFVWAAFPPLALYAHNQQYFELAELILPLAGSLLVAGVFWAAGRLVWKDPHERAFRVFAMVFCFHLAGHATSSVMGQPIAPLGREVDLGVVAAWAAGLLAAGLLACRMPGAGPRVTQALTFSSIVLVAMPAASIAKGEVQRLALRDLDFQGGLLSFARPVPLARAPHVFYVVLDAYARQDVLAEEYGLDNTPFLNALRQRGFYVADQSESNYFGTAESLASSLNMSYLEDLEGAGPAVRRTSSRSRAIGQNRVARALRSKGYSFVAFGNGITLTEAREADVFLDVAHVPLIDGEFFRKAVELTPLRWIGLGWARGDERVAQLHRARVLHTLETAPTLATSRAPIFAHVHVVSPHAPFVFDAQGNVPPRPPRDEASAKRAYADQLIYLNGRVLRMIDEILAASTRPVVIVVQGDHGPGPAPERVGLDFRVSPSRRRILNAYLFPDRDYSRLYDTISPVNTFRVILSQYLGLDLPLLPDKRP